MWNMITHFLTFTGGMSASVVLMCLLQCKYRPESATCTRFERQATGEIAPPRRSRAPEGWNRFI